MMHEMRNAYRILVGKPEGKRPLGRPRRRWENIRTERNEVWYESVVWIHVTQNRVHWRVL